MAELFRLPVTAGAIEVPARVISRLGIKEGGVLELLLDGSGTTELLRLPLTAGGIVELPARVMDQLRIKEGDEIEIEIDDKQNLARLRPFSSRKKSPFALTAAEERDFAQRDRKLISQEQLEELIRQIEEPTHTVAGA